MRVELSNRNFETALHWLQERKPELFTAVREIRLVSAGTLLCGCPSINGTFRVPERIIYIKARRRRVAWFVQVIAHELYHARRWDALGAVLWRAWRRHEREARAFAARMRREFLVAGENGQRL